MRRRHGDGPEGRHGRSHGWDEEERGWRGPGRGRGGRGRAFEYGQLRFIVLQMIADKPSHGYELIKAIESGTEGAYSPSPGVVYPTLAMLEDAGCIAAGTQDDNRRLYRITAAGRKFLAENKAAVDEAQARLVAAARQHAGTEAPQIVRAMHNLHTALRLRLEAPLTTAQIQAVAAALDATAVAIERV